MADDPVDKTRDIIEQALAELVDLGLEGGRPAAIDPPAFQMILRLEGLDDTAALMSLRQEIDDALKVAKDEAGGGQ